MCRRHKGRGSHREAGSYRFVELHLSYCNVTVSGFADRSDSAFNLIGEAAEIIEPRRQMT
jgi:hypothetical protein